MSFKAFNSQQRYVGVHCSGTHCTAIRKTSCAESKPEPDSWCSGSRWTSRPSCRTPTGRWRLADIWDKRTWASQTSRGSGPRRRRSLWATSKWCRAASPEKCNKLGCFHSDFGLSPGIDFTKLCLQIEKTPTQTTERVCWWNWPLNVLWQFTFENNYFLEDLWALKHKINEIEKCLLKPQSYFVICLLTLQPEFRKSNKSSRDIFF